MPIRSNGRILGVSNNPSKTSGPGIWDVDDQYTAGYGGNWDDDGDPFINNVILNLPASGTNGGANLTFLDSSPSAVTVTRNGDTYQGSFSPYAVNGWSAHFNGSSYLTLPSATFNEAQPSNATFTMEAYVMLLAYPASSASLYVRTIFGKGQTYLIFGIDFDGSLTLYTFDGSGRTGKAGNVPLGRWTHVAITVNSSVVTYFINGQRVGTSTYYGFSSAGLNTGANVGSTADPTGSTNVQWIGFISNARFTTSVLYTSNFTPTLIPLQPVGSNTKLLACHTYTWVDGSATPNTIGVSGSPKVMPISPFRDNNQRYSPSTHGGSGFFDGTSNFASNTGDFLSSTGTALGSGDYTVECWVYPTATTSSSFVLDTNLANNNGDGVFINWSSSFRFAYVASDATNVIASGNYPIFAWYHLAVVRSSGVTRGYVNGQLVGSLSAVNPNLTSTRYTIGTYTTRDSRFFPGYISDVRFTVGQALYTLNFTPPTQPLTTTSQNATASNVKYLLNFQNASIIDSSQKGQLYTRGSLALSNAVAKYASTSINFTGSTSNFITINDFDLYTYGTADFTIDMWVYMNTVAGMQNLFMSFLSGGSRYVQVYLNGAAPTWWDGVANIINGSSSLVISTWNHIAATRFNGTANLWLNGLNIGSASATTSLAIPSGGIYIGNNTNGAQIANMYLSNFRVTLGVARYTANFIPPQRANPLY